MSELRRPSTLHERHAVILEVGVRAIDAIDQENTGSRRRRVGHLRYRALLAGHLAVCLSPRPAASPDRPEGWSA